MKADLAGESIRDVATPVAPVAGKNATIELVHTVASPGRFIPTVHDN
jgi:hypothetical protein